MLGGVAAWLRWRKKRQAQGKPFDKPNFVISTGFQVVWEKFAQLWQIEMREVWFCSSLLLMHRDEDQSQSYNGGFQILQWWQYNGGHGS